MRQGFGFYSFNYVQKRLTGKPHTSSVPICIRKILESVCTTNISYMAPQYKIMHEQISGNLLQFKQDQEENYTQVYAQLSTITTDSYEERQTYHILYATLYSTYEDKFT